MNYQFIANEKDYKFEEFYFYDEKGKLTKSNYSYYEKYIDSDINILSLNVSRKYNKDEKIIEMDWTKSDSTYRFNRYAYKWNKKGRVTKEKEYNKEGRLLKTTSYEYVYDDKGSWIIRKLLVNKSAVETTYREIEYYN